MAMRRQTISFKIGSLDIGSDYPILIQTMGKLPLVKKNLHKLLKQMSELKSIGCDLIRYAVPDFSVIDAFAFLNSHKVMPVVADIHFDYKLAIAAAHAGADKIRINPGNIGTEWKVAEVLKICSEKNIPIRVGINSGSVEPKLRHKKKVEAMLESGYKEAEIFAKYNFNNVLFSLKSSSTQETIEANKAFAATTNFPLHLGVTEAGPLTSALVKSSVALSELLKEGIGNTIRISISDSPETEIIAAREILSACGLKRKGVNIISCPKCGRAIFDNENKFVNEIQNYLYNLDKEISVAIMGCPVNGPGEALDADIGITGSGNSIVLFKKGKLIKKVTKRNALFALKEEIDKL